MIEEISATDLKRRIDAGEDIQLIDVRQPEEWAFAKIEGAKLIPSARSLNAWTRSTRGARQLFIAKRGCEVPGRSSY